MLSFGNFHWEKNVGKWVFMKWFGGKYGGKSWDRDFLRVIYMLLQDLDDLEIILWLALRNWLLISRRWVILKEGLFSFPFKIEIEGFEPYWLKKDDFGEILLNILEMNGFGEKT